MAPQNSRHARWNCAWECKVCKGPDGGAQRNRADAGQCRKCKKSYFHCFGKNVDAEAFLPDKPEHASLRKALLDSKKQAQELQAQIKAIQDGTPIPQGATEGADKEEAPAAAEDYKENLDKAQKAFKELQQMSEGQRKMFSDFDEKLAEAKRQVEEATKAKFKGQPIDTQLRGARTRMEHSRQALENKKVGQQKLKLALDEAQKKFDAGEQAIADLAAKLEVQTRDYADLQNQSANQLVGKQGEQASAAVPAEIMDALQDLLKEVPEDRASNILGKAGIGPKNFGEWLEKITAGAKETSKATESSEQNPINVQREVLKIEAKTATGKNQEDDDTQEMDWEELLDIESFENADEETFKEEIATLVKAGFRKPDDDEGRQDTKKRIAEWARKRKQEDMARREEDRKSTAALKVIKAGKKSKGGSNK